MPNPSASWVGDHLEEMAPEWIGKPCIKNRHGFRWYLGGGESGGLLANEIHYRRDGEWHPINRIPQPDRAGGFVLESDPSRGVLPGGFVRSGDLTFGIYSMGVEDRGTYRPLWQPGVHGVTDSAVLQRLGPYEHEHRFLGCQKTQVVLPSMPDLAGGDLVLDYYAAGMAPPETCDCAPVAIDARGLSLPMWKRRTPWGKQEGIALDDLARMAFPVVLDPQISTGSYCHPFGYDNSFINAHGTASILGTACFPCGASHILWPDIGDGFAFGRFAERWNALAYSGTIHSAEVALAGCAGPWVHNVNDDFLFSRCDWAAYVACGGGDMDPLYDLILASVAVTPIGDLDEYAAFDDVYGTWKPLDANDIAHLNASDGLGAYLYWAFLSRADYTGYVLLLGETMGIHMGGMGAVAPPVLRFNFEGGWISVVGG